MPALKITLMYIITLFDSRSFNYISVFKKYGNYFLTSHYIIII